MNEEQKTEAVKNCQTFVELETVIIQNAPFISESRDTPIEWDAETLLRRISLVRAGNDIANVTRANGLREKVVELCARKF